MDVEMEVVVVDDGSSDGTPKALESFESDPRVVVVAHERNSGTAGLRLFRKEGATCGRSCSSRWR